MAGKKVSAVAIHALKEALCSIYWYKGDLRSFLSNCLTDQSVISSVSWENYKRQIVSDVVDRLCSNQEKYLGDIRRLFHEVAKMDSFVHLQNLEDGQKKAQRAKSAVQELRRIVESHDTATKESEDLEERRRREAERLRNNRAVIQRLEEIKTRYMDLVTSSSPQQRGFELEKVLYDLFDLFDLDPKASFRIQGEQIDGAFSLEGADYLFEAKWHDGFVSIGDLDAFAGKVKRKLDNTLGLFLSISGFSTDAVAAHSTGRPVVILMTGADLMAVLEQRMDFVSLLLRKRRHAAQTGNILFQVHEMM
ncbi:restriction endonuclease [Halomonas sp. M4R5S39]|uniref:restriction endonuclease n=1 Tax=Halomonas kalidii TaxID=3043293 RepID=UPI0024A852B0|nr:restriction endonuclease [Halomonas kalidii]MDI5986266.1 restriction endonuclease [Halomonas kalidii]